MDQLNAPVMTRPTPMAERTLAAALVALCLVALALACLLTFHAWPDNPVSPDIVHWLGIALVISLVGILVLIIGFISPWLGSVRLSGLGAQIDIAGEDSPRGAEGDPAHG